MNVIAIETSYRVKKKKQILLTPKRFTSSVYLVVDGYIYMWNCFAILDNP